jgi:hypothetical protein
VREVDHAEARLDLEHHALADRDRVVARAEVGEEDDGRRAAGPRRRRDEPECQDQAAHGVF